MYKLIETLFDICLMSSQPPHAGMGASGVNTLYLGRGKWWSWFLTSVGLIQGKLKAEIAKAFVRCIKVKHFKRNIVDDTGLGGMESLQQQNIYLWTHKQMSVFWRDTGIRMWGHSLSEMMCHMHGTYGEECHNYLLHIHNLYWSPCRSWENFTSAFIFHIFFV